MTAHVHAWQPIPGRAPWMRACACGAEGYLVGGRVVEMGARAAVKRLRACCAWWGVAGVDVPGRGGALR